MKKSLFVFAALCVLAAMPAGVWGQCETLRYTYSSEESFVYDEEGGVQQFPECWSVLRYGSLDYYPYLMSWGIVSLYVAKGYVVATPALGIEPNHIHLTASIYHYADSGGTFRVGVLSCDSPDPTSASSSDIHWVEDYTLDGTTGRWWDDIDLCFSDVQPSGHVYNFVVFACEAHDCELDAYLIDHIEIRYDTVPTYELRDMEEYHNLFPYGYCTVNYTRAYPWDLYNKWLPLFVPFNAPVYQWNQLGKVAELRSVSRENGVDVLDWHLLTEEDSMVLAGMPYIFLPIPMLYSNYPTTIPFGEVSMASETEQHTVSCSNGEGLCYTLTGTYEERHSGDVGMPSVWYALSGGNFVMAGDDAGLRPQRFYLTITTPSGEYAPAPSGGTIMRVEGQEVGILEPESSLILPVDNNYYDLLGRRVSQPQKGHIYIYNHQKIIY